MCNGDYRWEKERQKTVLVPSVENACGACAQNVQIAVESIYDYGDAVGKALVGDGVTLVGGQSFYVDAQGEVRKFSSGN